MKCIIIDDEPIARRGIQRLVTNIDLLQFSGSFENASAASSFLKTNDIDLIFLDIQMPGLNGIEFAKQIRKNTLIIFTTAYAEYALDSYDVDAIDYLVKPINRVRFQKAVDKAVSYHSMLRKTESDGDVPHIQADFILIKSDRRFFKIDFADILFIEGLKDYVIVQTESQRLITHMNLKTIHKLLPAGHFLRVNRSYIVNAIHINSFTNNDVFIREYEIPIGNFYRDSFLNILMGKM